FPADHQRDAAERGEGGRGRDERLLCRRPVGAAGIATGLADPGDARRRPDDGGAVRDAILAIRAAATAGVRPSATASADLSAAATTTDADAATAAAANATTRRF